MICVGDDDSRDWSIVAQLTQLAFGKIDWIDQEKLVGDGNGGGKEVGFDGGIEGLAEGDSGVDVVEVSGAHGVGGWRKGNG
jgi:hypothetical protein